MTLNELRTHMYTSMRENNKIAKETYSSIINTANNAAIAAGDKDNVTEEMVENAIRKELKVIKEQIETCPESREDKLAEYKAKRMIVEGLMPKQMNADEIKAYLDENFAEVLETKNKGLIMKTVMPTLKGKADGKLINEVISGLL